MTATKRSKPSIGEDTGLENNATGQDKGTTFTDRQAIKHLKELYLERQRFKHPTLPYYSAPAFSASTSNGLTKCIITFLRIKGHQAERISSQGRIIDNRQTFTDSVGYRRTIGSIQRIKSSGQVVTADISAIFNSLSVKIEVKNAKTHDRQSQAQKIYQQQVEAAQGIYFIAESLGQFIGWYYEAYREGADHE